MEVSEMSDYIFYLGGDDEHSVALMKTDCTTQWNTRKGECSIEADALAETPTSLPWLDVCDGPCTSDNQCAPGLRCSSHADAQDLCKMVESEDVHSSWKTKYCTGVKTEMVRLYNVGTQRYLTVWNDCSKVRMLGLSDTMMQDFYLTEDGKIASANCRGKVVSFYGWLYENTESESDDHKWKMLKVEGSKGIHFQPQTEGSDSQVFLGVIENNHVTSKKFYDRIDIENGDVWFLT